MSEEQNAKQRARPTSLEGGPGTKPASGDDAQSFNQPHPPEAEQASPLRATSRTEMEESIAEEAEGGMAARTAQEMSLHDELSRTPSSSDSKQASAPSQGTPEAEEPIEQVTQHEKRRAAQQPEAEHA